MGRSSLEILLEISALRQDPGQCHPTIPNLSSSNVTGMAGSSNNSSSSGSSYSSSAGTSSSDSDATSSRSSSSSTSSDRGCSSSSVLSSSAAGVSPGCTWQPQGSARFIMVVRQAPGRKMPALPYSAAGGAAAVAGGGCGILVPLLLPSSEKEQMWFDRGKGIIMMHDGLPQI